MLQKSKKLKISNIVIGHHLDDLYENFFLRLTRGSGLKGLASFSEVKTNYNDKFRVLRPLINLKKEKLISITKKVFKFYIEDPSNKNINFKRVRIRKLFKDLKSEGFSLEKFKLTVNNLRDSNITINYYVNQNIENNSKYLNNKKYYILNKKFFHQPNEIVFRSLIILLKKVGNRYYPPRGKSVTQLLLKFQFDQIRKINISGCIIEKINNSFIIYKEK